MSLESEKIKREREELEIEKKQWIGLLERTKDNLAQLEAAPKTFREFLQSIADTAELRIKAEEVLETMRFFVFNAIHRFQVVPTVEEAINAYANLLFFSQDLIPPGMFVKHASRLERISGHYATIWKEPIAIGRGIRVSRIAMSDVYGYFYEIVHYLLRLRFLTAEDAEKTYVSFLESKESIMGEHGGGLK